MDFDHPFTTTNPGETARLGQELGDYLRQTIKGKRKKGSGSAVIICLYGDLGSGKTTFAQGFAKGLGITTRLLSPTFIIVRRYSLIERGGFLYHLDLYRLESIKGLRELGLSEILTDKDSIVLIEWADKLGDLLPKERIDVRFSVTEDGKHNVFICKAS